MPLELFEEVSPFFAEERRAAARWPRGLRRGRPRRHPHRRLGRRARRVDYSNLPFLAAQNPYVELLRANAGAPDVPASDEVAFTVYGWSRRPLYASAATPGRSRMLYSESSTTGARAVLDGDRRPRRGLGRLPAERPRRDLRGGPSAGVASRTPVGAGRMAALAGLAFAALLVALTVAAWLAAARRCRAGPCCARCGPASIARCSSPSSPPWSCRWSRWPSSPAPTWPTSLRADIEREATRSAAFSEPRGRGLRQHRGGGATTFRCWTTACSSGSAASSARTSTSCRHRPAGVERAQPVRLRAAADPHPGDVYRALALDGGPRTWPESRSAPTSTCVASAPVRVGDGQAIVSVPLTLRQRGIERQLDELDRRVLLAAITSS